MVRNALLVVLTAASGVVDAISFLGLDRVFTANMTGNLVLLGISASQETAKAFAGPATAVAGFLLGALLMNRTARRTTELRLWPLPTRIALTAVLLLETGVCSAWAVTAGHPRPPVELMLIAGFGIAMGIQSTAVRALSVSGVTTTFVTGTLADLVFRPTAKVRRFAVVLSLAVGAAAGALLLELTRPLAPALAPVLVALVVAGAWLQSWLQRRTG